MELEEQVKAGTSEEDKKGALERLNNALREELQEALDKIETQRGDGEVLQREKEELRRKLFRMEEQAEVQCGVAEAKVGMLLQQVAASQQAELALKMQAVEQDGQRAALARELHVCQAEQARKAADIERIAAERDEFAGEAAQLRVEREVRQKQVEALVEAKERAVGQAVELAAANERSFDAREIAEVQERQLRADLEEAQKQMEVLVGEKERAQEHLVEARAAEREKWRALEEQRRAFEDALEGARRKVVEIEDAVRREVRRLEEEKRTLQEALEGVKRQQVEMENAGRERVRKLEGQKSSLEEVVEGMKRKLDYLRGENLRALGGLKEELRLERERVIYAAGQLGPCLY
ncbi:unnamed protein product [Closterium sp. Naga37s-1]|nr:unnamed protein product [Closterium sp. Naga37s-1]